MFLNVVINIWRAFSCLLRGSELETGSIANCTGNEIQSSCLKHKQLHTLFTVSSPLLFSFLYFCILMPFLSLFILIPLHYSCPPFSLYLNLLLSTLHSRSLALSPPCLLLPFRVVFTDFLLCTTSDKHVLQKVSSPLCPFRKPRKSNSTERYFRQSERTG